MATLKTIKENPPSNYLTKLAVIESNNNPNAKAKTSSASGAFQFIESTWKGLTNKYKLGYSLDDRFDPIKSKKVADLLTKENENTLRPILGREPNDGERYLGHFLGTQGSKQLLSTYFKNPNEKIGNVVSGGALKANKSIFLNKDGSQKTVGDIYNWSAKKMNIKPTYVNTPSQNNNQPQKTITPTLNYFGIPKQTTTFASVPDSMEEDTTEKIEEVVTSKDVAEVEQKTKEYNFLDDLQKQDYSHLQPQQVAQQQVAPQVDYMQQYEQVSRFVDEPLVVQQGGSVKEDKKWLQNWYQNRVIPDEVIQNEYFLPQQKDYVNRAKNLKNPKIVDQVTSPDGMLVEGVTKANGDIEISKNAAPHVQLHEMTHSINKYPFLMQDIHKNIVEQNIAPIEAINNEDVKKYYDYFSDPEEVHARIQVLRKEAKIKPDQKVTPEFLQDYFKTYKGENSNINDLLNVVDEPHLLEMLNYMAQAPKNKEKQHIVQQGGKFSKDELAFLSEIAIKDNNGYWNPTNQGKVVEIEGDKITMKGVKEDLVGISKQTGERKIMKPNKNYTFSNTKSVIEIPLFKK